MGQRGRPRSAGLLTPRERDVLALVREGLTNEQIGTRLGISFETAKHHVSEIISKLGVSTREEAAAWREEIAARWSFGRIVLALLGAGIVAGAVAGLALLTWGLSQAGGGGEQTAAVTASPTAAAGSPSPTPTAGGVPVPNVLLRSLWMADTNNGWLGGSTRACQEASASCVGVIFHTSDGGASWDEQYSGEVQVSGLAFTDAEFGLAIGSIGDCSGTCASNAVLRTTDGGLHWEQVMTTPLQLTNIAAAADNPWIVGKNCTADQPTSACTTFLLASTDGGDKWNQTALPVTGFASDLTRPTANDAWLVTSPAGPGISQIIATHDAGRTWQEVTTPEGGAGFERRLFFLTPELGWLALAGQPGAGSQAKEVFSTTDGGETWTHLTGTLGAPGGGAEASPGQGIPTSGYLGPMVFTSDADGWMASSRMGLLHTTDGGANWSIALQDDNLFAVQFTDAQHGWTLSLVNLWSTADGGATWQAITPPDTASPATQAALTFQTAPNLNNARIPVPDGWTLSAGHQDLASLSPPGGSGESFSLQYVGGPASGVLVGVCGPGVTTEVTGPVEIAGHAGAYQEYCPGGWTVALPSTDGRATWRWEYDGATGLGEGPDAATYLAVLRAFSEPAYPTKPPPSAS